MKRAHSFGESGTFAAAVLLLYLAEATNINPIRAFNGIVKEGFDSDQVPVRRHDVFFSWCSSGREDSDRLESTHIRLLHACLCSEQSLLDTHIMLRLATSDYLFPVWFSHQTDKQQVLFAGRAASREECVLAAVPLLGLRGREIISVITFEERGDQLMTHNMTLEAVLGDTVPCSAADPWALLGGRRPRLRTSFVVEGRDSPLQVEHDQSLEEAAFAFIERHSLHLSTFDFIVSELAEGLLATQRHREELRNKVAERRAQGYPLRVVLGASFDEAWSPELHFGPMGWLGFSVNDLDLTAERDFRYYFEEMGSVDAILAEHVLEHLSVDDALYALVLCRKYLKKGSGYLRVAVPDWGASDNTSRVKVERDIAAGHLVQYNVGSLTQALELAGFDVRAREWQWGETLHRGLLDPLAGLVRRSSCFESRRGRVSLVLDARPVMHIDQTAPFPSDPGRSVQELLKGLAVGDVDAVEAAEVLGEALTADPCAPEALHLVGRLLQLSATGQGMTALEDELLPEGVAVMQTLHPGGDMGHCRGLLAAGTWLTCLALRVIPAH